jgi:hypothetical protein
MAKLRNSARLPNFAPSPNKELNTNPLAARIAVAIIISSNEKPFRCAVTKIGLDCGSAREFI